MGYAVSQSNTSEPLSFLLILSADHITGATGKSPTVTISKNGGAFASPAGAVTELGSGWYSVAANAVDASTLGPLLLHATATDCDPTDDVFDIVSYNPSAFAPVTTPAGPDAISALQIINDAFELINVLGQGETLESDEADRGLRLLNQIVAQYALQPLTKTAIAREAFTLVSGQGTPANPYTIGIGADFDTTRPIRIWNAALNITSASTPFEIPIEVYSDQAYEAIALKTQTAPYPTGLYYSPTYASGWGSIFLYPVPTETNDLILYLEQALALFASLTTPYDLPPGAAPMLTYKLAKRLHRPYGREWSAALESDLNEYTAVFQRANTKMVDLTLDAALTRNPWGRYNILSDSNR